MKENFLFQTWHFQPKHLHDKKTIANTCLRLKLKFAKVVAGSLGPNDEVKPTDWNPAEKKTVFLKKNLIAQIRLRPMSLNFY